MDWPAYCQVCQRRYRASELRLRYDGKRVCSDDYETRHPLDFARTIVDDLSLPWTSPRQADVFVGGVCTADGISSLADKAVADCAIADLLPSL